MGLMTWILLGVVVVAVIGLGVGVFFGGLVRGAEIIGENPAVQNASSAAKGFIQDRFSNSSIALTADDSSYKSGDSVRITATNNGDETKSFPDAALGLQVRNEATGMSYPVLSAQVITELGPGQSKTIIWKDDSAPPGEYVASVTDTNGDSAKVRFEISG